MRGIEVLVTVLIETESSTMNLSITSFDFSKENEVIHLVKQAKNKSKSVI